MAKWGAGDPRWIVEERPDSTNVNNWHWTERDATTWSSVRLKKLFLDIRYENEEGCWAIKDVKSLDGESSINNRKGKLIFFFEWSVKLEYSGKLSEGTSEHTGTIEIPNLSDENSPSDLDIQVHSKNDSKNGEKLKGLIQRTGISLVREACSQYIKDLKDEFSTGMVLPTKECTNSTQSASPAMAVKTQAKQSIVDGSKPEPSKYSNVHLKLELTEEFKTTAEELYRTLTCPDRISAFTRAPCDMQASVGGKFTIMTGNVHGEFLQLVEYSKIVQKWRFKDWPEGLWSTVTIDLKQKSDCTMLELRQTGVPDYDIDRTENGWKHHFFGPIKQTFGFGAQLF